MDSKTGMERGDFRSTFRVYATPNGTLREMMMFLEGVAFSTPGIRVWSEVIPDDEGAYLRATVTVSYNHVGGHPAQMLKDFFGADPQRDEETPSA